MDKRDELIEKFMLALVSNPACVQLDDNSFQSDKQETAELIWDFAAILADACIPIE